MSDAFLDQFIADLVKGAERNSRANGGPGVNILIDRENHGREEKLASYGVPGALEQRFNAGAEAALDRLGVKTAFFPLLGLAGSIAGPALARAGVGAAAKGALGQGAAGMAGKLMPKIQGGLGSGAFDAAASMGGGAIGGKLQQKPQGAVPPPPI